MGPCRGSLASSKTCAPRLEVSADAPRCVATPPAASVGTTVPLHRPSGAGPRTVAVQSRRAGGAEVEDVLARTHDAPGDVAAGVHEAAGGAEGDVWGAFLWSLFRTARASDCSAATNSGQRMALKGRYVKLYMAYTMHRYQLGIDLNGVPDRRLCARPIGARKVHRGRFKPRNHREALDVG